MTSGDLKLKKMPVIYFYVHIWTSKNSQTGNVSNVSNVSSVSNVSFGQRDAATGLMCLQATTALC